METRRKTCLGITIMAVVSIALSIFSMARAETISVHFTLLNTQQSAPNAAWWSGKSNLLWDHNYTGFPGSDDQGWDWWGYVKDFTGPGHYYYSEINFDTHDPLPPNPSANTPNCSEEDYYFKGLPAGYINVSGVDKDSEFDMVLRSQGNIYNIEYQYLDIYGWALVKAPMRHTSDFSFAEPGEGEQASGGVYDPDTNRLDAWLNIVLDFINPGMSEIDTQEAWVDGFEQKGYIIPKSEFSSWFGGGSPQSGKYMVPTYELSAGNISGTGVEYPPEYIETGEQDAGSWLDDFVNDVRDEIEDADFLYIAFSRDNFLIDEDGIQGKKPCDGGNLKRLHPEAWPIIGKSFLNDETIWFAKGKIGIAPPTFTPDPGIYPLSGVWVEMICITEGATIYYTTDGSDPTQGSYRYTHPILITGTTILKARAYKEGFEPGPVAEGQYTIQECVTKPEFVPEPDYYWPDEDVELKCQIEGARIYYTTDGSIPDESSTEYTHPILITGTTTLKARAYKANFEPSIMAEGDFIIRKKLRKPEFLPEAQVFDPPFMTVRIDYFSIGGIKYPNLDATFYYTTDGTDPDESSTEYTGPITLFETTTLKTRAYKEGFEPSEVTTKIYVNAGGLDSDGDGVLDLYDNCRLTPNSGQQDTDSDGYGNMCDCDLDNNDAVGASDYNSFCNAWQTTDPDADFDSDGTVGTADYGIFSSRWNETAPFE